MGAVRYDLVVANAQLATMTGAEPYGSIRDGALAIAGERIAWVGAARDLPASARGATTLDAGGRWVTPGLVDCHTHLVYAGNRAHEFERRLEGATYADIARAGGGIAATVRATRAASTQALVAQSRPRLAALAAEGVTTVEIKSGYGLDTVTERRMLEAARIVAADVGVDVRTTLLAAHALPPEFASRRDDYVDLVCRETIPAVAGAGLADAVDAFCETIGFTPEETRRVFAAAREHGLPVKLHADQLADSGGAALAAEFGALSADHLEYASEDGVAALARAGTVAVLLPGAFYALREARPPPVAALRAHGVPMAIATDCNPGTSPVTSLVLMLNFACILFRLTPAEALAGATKHAARALGLVDRGTLAPGQRADLALWNVAEPAELAYAIGGNPCAGVVRAGAVVRWEMR
ncbi:MAG TPA: imidazolonepropionase [Casimicrobiaceae bacterium]|jgi:imidazolonepropionase|nr:imidazolonepropionase [Casimicrobiaceae bacterium]